MRSRASLAGPLVIPFHLDIDLLGALADVDEVTDGVQSVDDTIGGGPESALIRVSRAHARHIRRQSVRGGTCETLTFTNAPEAAGNVGIKSRSQVSAAVHRDRGCRALCSDGVRQFHELLPIWHQPHERPPFMPCEALGLATLDE